MGGRRPGQAEAGRVGRGAVVNVPGRLESGQVAADGPLVPLRAAGLQLGEDLPHGQPAAYLRQDLVDLGAAADRGRGVGKRADVGLAVGSKGDLQALAVNDKADLTKLILDMDSSVCICGGDKPAATTTGFF
jgi:hypothetical protein